MQRGGYTVFGSDLAINSSTDHDIINRQIVGDLADSVTLAVIGKGGKTQGRFIQIILTQQNRPLCSL